MKQFVNLSKILLLLLVVTLISCNRNKQKKQAESSVVYTEEQAKEISFVTSGNVHYDDIIEVIFNSPVVEENEVGTSPGNVFDFTPNIKGHATWEKRDILRFYPDKTLPVRTSIEGKLNLQKLAPRFSEMKIEDLIFRLNVLGREISGFNGSLELKDRNDPKILIYTGTLGFSEKTSLADIQKAAQIKGGKDITLNWSQIDDRNFQFSSSNINRTDNNQEFTFYIDKKSLDLEYDYTETFAVTPLKKMLANDFRVDEAGRKPRVRIIFSDELDMDQDINGLISVSPQVDVEVKKLGNTVILDGNFKFGGKYNITVQKGIRSRWGTKTESEESKELKFSDIPPQLEFASDGIVLPSSNQKKIQFYTTNLKRVHLEVKKVFTNKIGQFLRSQQLSSSRNRNKDFNFNYESSVGVIIKNQTIELGKQDNEWLLNEFDLSDLFSKYQDGLFLIRINFTPEDVSLPIEGNVLDYILEKGQVYKPVFLSNLGITVKNAEGEAYVFVTDILTGKPRSSVKVSLLKYNGEIQSSATTNKDGLAVFRTDQYYYYYVMATEDRQVTALNRSEMQWSNSGFDISGVSENRNNTKGFIYTERGVYRPGDSIHIGFIVRNNNNTFPRNHPVNISVKDPQYNTIFEQTSVKSTDGYYVFGFKTEENAPTGTYNIRINAGGSWFYQDLKIETVVAEQLDVQVKPHKKEIAWNDKSVDFDVSANYLFGAPAANLKAEVDIEVHPYEMTFPKYTDYSFTRADVEFNTSTQNVLKKELDAQGQLSGSWQIPPLGTVPSALKLKIIAKVLEKSGQPNEGWNVVNMHVYPDYVGLKDPSGYGYYKTGQEVKFPVVLLDTEGNPLTGKQLQYRIYRNDKMWWYQYDSRRNFRLKYKEDNQTYLETEGNIDLHEGSNYVVFTPAENGEYLIEVSDGGNGHTASLFFSAYKYGSIPGGDQNEGTLALKSNKAKYAPGEVAKINIPNPKQGNILVSLEKGSEILDWYWVDPSKSNSDELVIEIPVTRDMIPNVYAAISVIQPHSQTVNDRPIRMFGIIPLMVEDPSTKIMFHIDAPENLVPNQDFTVKLSTENQEKAQFTIAVVDEGLLSLTQFRTPQPWKEFYKKIGLFVETYDIFSHVISANKGDVFQTFSIGGSDDLDYRESQLEPVEGEKRFEPVCMFTGPLNTDEQGNARVTFHMPNYNGAVRIMVIGADNRNYGSEEKTIPVRSEIIMQPGIPRVLKPGDEFILPVALFKTDPKIKNAQFTINTEGPLEVTGDKKINVDFSQKTEADIRFNVKAKDAVGQAKITIEGVSGETHVLSETNIKVVPGATRIYDKLTQKIEKGKSIDLKVPKAGIDGTNNASLEISIFPNMDFDHRLKWLIRYPYGCIEQTTSAVFPQLYLKKLGYFPQDESREIDKNINDGIQRLQLFMLNGGGFSYWPGSTTPSEWGSNYASHFLVEAKKMGYSVPDFMYDNAIEGMERDARNHQGHLITRVNRSFILALAGKQPMSEMNMLMENELNNMNSAEKWMLAAAYYLAGAEDVSTRILSGTGTTTVEYEPFSYSFGSKYRDDAIILYCATLMKKTDVSELMAKSIASVLSGKEYLSTQSSGYMLLALGKYFDVIGVNASAGQIVSGTVTLADGTTREFNENGRFTLNIRNNFDKNIRVILSGNSNVDQAYITLSWNGVPLMDESKAVQKNLNLEVNWYDDKGNTINPQNLKQGATFYGRFSVKKTSPVSRVSEVALVQIIPSGWQIENTRLNNTLLPDWTNSWNLNRENYLDIRDDRVMWFFDIDSDKPLDFVVKLNCITAGEFRLPGTLVEAMYNNDFRATTEEKKINVQSFK